MDYHAEYAADCPCQHPTSPHLVSQAAYLRTAAQAGATARNRNPDGTFQSKEEAAWDQIPDGQKKILGYRKPRKGSKKR